MPVFTGAMKTSHQPVCESIDIPALKTSGTNRACRPILDSSNISIPTSPSFRRVDQLPRAAVGIESPCALLLENGPFFSVLVAREVEWVSLEYRWKLRLAFQFKLTRSDEAIFRGFPEVDVSRHRSGIWVAKDCESHRLFSSPSFEPYRLVFLPTGVYEIFREDTKSHTPERIWACCRLLFGRLPGFYSPDKDTLMAPDDYAAAGNWFPGHEFL
ncbi:MAG: hypothetical protein CMO55_02835 [Verrucomicrobiales bacterium]|nr:hypothetical protein [Verrucomicrobiales bacterium]